MICIVAKTFLRPHYAKEILVGWHCHLKPAGVPLVLVDDGSPSARQELPSKAWTPPTIYVRPNFDVGLSEGRNLGVLGALELGAEYCVILNDDMTIDRDSASTILGACDYLARHPGIDVLGLRMRIHGLADPHPFYTRFHVNETGVLLRWPEPIGSRVDDHTPTDMCWDSMIARTQFLVANPWDRDLKLGEHWEYFWRIRKSQARVAVYERGLIAHSRTTRDYKEDGDTYAKYRSRHLKFQRIALRKHGLTGYRDLEGSLYPARASNASNEGVT